VEKINEKLGMLLMEMKKTQLSVRNTCEKQGSDVAHLAAAIEQITPLPPYIEDEEEEEAPLGAEAAPLAPFAPPPAPPAPAPAPPALAPQEQAEGPRKRKRSGWILFSANYAQRNPTMPRDKEWPGKIAAAWEEWKRMNPGKDYQEFRGSDMLPARRQTKKKNKLLPSSNAVQVIPSGQPEIPATPGRTSPLRPLPVPEEEAQPSMVESAIAAVSALTQPTPAPAPEPSPALAPEPSPAPAPTPALAPEPSPVRAPEPAPEQEVSEEEEGAGLSTQIIQGKEYYKTNNNGLFARDSDEQGNPSIGEWVGYLQDDGTIRYTNGPNSQQTSA
jgi:hypothetical protein